MIVAHDNKKKETSMQITLNQQEIEQALEDYVNARLNIRGDQSVGIDLRAGRGPEGYTANITLTPAGLDQDASIQPSNTSAATVKAEVTKEAPKPKVSKAGPFKKAEAKAEAKDHAQPEVAQEAPQTTASNDSDVRMPWDHEGEQTAQGTAQEVSEEAAKDETMPPPIKAKGSLFGNAKSA